MTTTAAGLRPASSYAIEDLARLLNRAFAGYPICLQESPAEFARRLAVDSVSLDESVVVLAPGGEPAGLCLVGRRAETLRVGAMGVVPAARRCGLGRVLMQQVMDRARRGAAARVILEVLEQNAPARALYETLGFATTRRLVGFTRDDTRSRPCAPLTGRDRELVEVAHADVARVVATDGIPDPPWQMQAESIAALGPPCRAFSLGGKAFVLLREARDGVLSMRGLVLARAARGRGIGRLFVEALRARFPRRRWRVAPRVPEGLADDFFLKLGFEKMKLAQVEMVLPLDQRPGTG